MAGIFSWFTSPSSNTVLDGINVNTGMSPSNVDNSFRSLMAVVRQSFAAGLETFLNGTTALPVANGGTGATDAATALANLGGLSATYRDLPTVNKSASFTFANSERGGLILWTASGAGTGTIDPFATTPISIGAAYVIYNSSGTTLAISPGAGVFLAKNGAATSSSAALGAGAVANLIHASGDTWLINGVGVV